MNEDIVKRIILTTIVLPLLLLGFLLHNSCWCCMTRIETTSQSRLRQKMLMRSVVTINLI